MLSHIERGAPACWVEQLTRQCTDLVALIHRSLGYGRHFSKLPPVHLKP
jgi:hypothetical protein